VCVYAANIGAGYTTPRLGCATVTVTTKSSLNPKGRVTDVRVAGTRLVVEGWSFDPDSPRSATTVRVWANGLRLGELKADDRRPSVGKYYPSAGSAHGFTLGTRLTPGRHRVCVWAFNRGIGTTNPNLGCRTVTVTASPFKKPITSGSPLGRLASFELDGQDLSITGWTFDPDAAPKPATVQVVAGGKLVAETVASGDWPDVQRHFPYAGSAHKFSWRGILPAGSYSLCVRAVDVGAGSTRSLSCRSVTVVGDPKANPLGGPRVAEVDGSTVRIAGWSYDPDVPTRPVKVRIYSGSTTLATVDADGDWPDVGKYHPAAGSAHGFEWTGDRPAGEHKICVQAYNVEYGTTDPVLGCTTVTVGSVAAEADGSAPPSAATRTGATPTGATSTEAASTGATSTGSTSTGSTSTGATQTEAPTGAPDSESAATSSGAPTGTAGTP
jgi:hypothetical protein